MDASRWKRGHTTRSSVQHPRFRRVRTAPRRMPTHRFAASNPQPVRHPLKEPTRTASCGIPRSDDYRRRSSESHQALQRKTVQLKFYANLLNSLKPNVTSASYYHFEDDKFEISKNGRYIVILNDSDKEKSFNLNCGKMKDFFDCMLKSAQMLKGLYEEER